MYFIALDSRSITWKLYLSFFHFAMYYVLQLHFQASYFFHPSLATLAQLDLVHLAQKIYSIHLIGSHLAFKPRTHTAELTVNFLGN